MTGNETLKRMADLLKQGATLLDVQCPNCNTPLFRLSDGKMYCSACQKHVVRGVNEVTKTTQNSVVNSLNQTIFNKLDELNSMIGNEKDQEKITVLLNNLVKLLEASERIRHLKEM